MIQNIIFFIIATSVFGAGCRKSIAESAAEPTKIDQIDCLHDGLSKNWEKHTITHLDPDHHDLKIPALFQYISDPWNRIALYPFIQYIPEKHRLIAAIGCDDMPLHKPFLVTSDDGGATWSKPRPPRTDTISGLSSICYMGKGKVMLTVGFPRRLCFSDDYGETFPRTIPVNSQQGGQQLNDSGIPLVDRNPETGKIDRLIGIRYGFANDQDQHNQPFIRFSTNLGRTWSKDRPVPQWKGFNEAQMIRAKNGDLVCCLRSDIHKRYKNRNLDHFGGMGVSISKNNGETWSNINLIYDWGRHHQSLVLMPNGNIVMTYVVRAGYPPAANGYTMFGIEAIVSHDHGQTWDLDRTYVLYEWVGHLVGDRYWMASPQITSTALLPDGDLITIFGSGEREMGYEGDPRRIGVVRWRLAKSVKD